MVLFDRACKLYRKHSEKQIQQQSHIQNKVAGVKMGSALTMLISNIILYKIGFGGRQEIFVKKILLIKTQVGFCNIFSIIQVIFECV